MAVAFAPNTAPEQRELSYSKKVPQSLRRISQLIFKDAVPKTEVSVEGSSVQHLPNEIWRSIIRFTIRLIGATAIELDDPFSPPYFNEEHPIAGPGLFSDRKSLRRVNKFWNSVVEECSAEYLIIYSAKSLAAHVKTFEFKTKKKKRYGEWTTRVDFQIDGPYPVEEAVRLFQYTPNLMIYKNCNNSAHFPERCTPRAVLQALARYCQNSLQRLEWSGKAEIPRFQDLAILCDALPNLTALRLAGIFSYPHQRTSNEPFPPILNLPKLKTLSLAVIPEPNEQHIATYSLTWDPLLTYLSLNADQLPSLERFDCDVFPINTITFFHKHGPKILHFRTTTWSTDRYLPEALTSCPNLQSLVLAHGSEFLGLPVFHPTLKRICIVPCVEAVIEVPQKVLNYAVMAPLDKLLESIAIMTAPALIELRIRNIGAFSNIIDYSTWLHHWWRRWHFRGIHFGDKTGTSFDKVKDPREILLDSVRA